MAGWSPHLRLLLERGEVGLAHQLHYGLAGRQFLHDPVSHLGIAVTSTVLFMYETAPAAISSWLVPAILYPPGRGEIYQALCIPLPEQCTPRGR
jgi:hypothetical protein